MFCCFFKFITSDHFITSSSSGTLNLYEISKDQSVRKSFLIFSLLILPNQFGS